VPRQMIIPAFWAKNSEKLNNYDWSSVFGVNNPTGYLPANKLADGSIPAGKIQTNTITAAQIAPASITSNQIASGTISAGNLSPQLALASIVPPGTIVAFGGANPPAGWLLCDGTPVNSGRYAALFAAIGTNWGSGTAPVGTNDFSLPDLRGLFLRGVNGARTNFIVGVTNSADPDVLTRTNSLSGGSVGNAVGSLQLDSFRDHQHYSYDGHNGIQVAGYSPSPDIAVTVDNRGGIYNPGGEPTTGALAGGGAESRPRNAYVNYIIKY